MITILGTLYPIESLGVSAQAALAQGVAKINVPRAYCKLNVNHLQSSQSKRKPTHITPSNLFNRKSHLKGLRPVWTCHRSCLFVVSGITCTEGEWKTRITFPVAVSKTYKFYKYALLLTRIHLCKHPSPITSTYTYNIFFSDCSFTPNVVLCIGPTPLPPVYIIPRYTMLHPGRAALVLTS